MNRFIFISYKTVIYHCLWNYEGSFHFCFNLKVFPFPLAELGSFLSTGPLLLPDPSEAIPELFWFALLGTMSNSTVRTLSSKKASWYSSMALLASSGLLYSTVADPKKTPKSFLSNLHTTRSPILAKSFYIRNKDIRNLFLDVEKWLVAYQIKSL